MIYGSRLTIFSPNTYRTISDCVGTTLLSLLPPRVRPCRKGELSTVRHCYRVRTVDLRLTARREWDWQEERWIMYDKDRVFPNRCWQAVGEVLRLGQDINFLSNGRKPENCTSLARDGLCFQRIICFNSRILLSTENGFFAGLWFTNTAYNLLSK